jgi:serine phosphatase RsbU (regulator of sigma subunit)
VWKLIGTDGRRYYSWNLEPGKFVLGRKPECDFYISDKTVSRKHAELEVESPTGPCFLIDLESHNGTMVNGQRITSRVEVKQGDHIMFGSVEFKLTEGDIRQSTGPSKTPTNSLFTEIEPERSVFLSINDALQPLPTKVIDRPEVMPTLFEMAKMLIVPEPKEVMLERSLALVTKAIPSERLAVLLTAEDPKEVYMAACHLPGESDAGCFTLSKTIVNEILSNKNSVLIGNPEEDPRFATQQSIIMSQLKSAMAVPLFVEGKVLGILYADTSDPRHRYSDEYLRLFATFGNLIAFRLLNYNLLTELQEKQVIESEIRHASVIQRNLLTKETPELAGYQIYAFQEQCHAVGGDLYDLDLLPDGRLLFMVADVSGKGMGAALLMSNILASFRILYNERQFDLSKAVNQVSMQLFNHSASDNFATLFIGLVNPKEDMMTFVNAGHNPPLLVRKDGKIEYLEASGTMIGAFDFSGWAEERVKLSHGDLVFVFTDGITEAVRGEEFYGEERIERLVTDTRDNSPEEIAHRLLDDIKAFVKESPRSDDITMLLIKKDRPC